jgi:outer membrane protein OmpA-like peptidoglycan-associated protein
MRVTRLMRVLTTLVALAGTIPNTSSAQLGGLKKRAEEAAKKKLADAAKKNAADSAKAKATADSAKAKAAAAAAAAADSSKAAIPTAAPGSSASALAKADPKVWENYDFVPGSKVLFYTDFSEDKVGNFARRLKHVAGPIEVVERDGSKVLRSTGRSVFLIPLATKLPEKFTLEIDIIAPTNAGCCGYEVITLEGGPTMDRGDKSVSVNWNSSGGLLMGGGQNAGTSTVKFPDAMQEQVRGRVAHIRVLMDGAYFKMYTNERRMYNIPELWFKRDSVIRIFMNGGEESGNDNYITSIRVAQSETDVLYDALAAKGRWATQGILFATGKADLKPESRPVLKEIATTLKEHGDLKVLIEGHTDNVGSAAANLTLSEARAAAVKAALVADFAIEAGRITTKGLGDTKPAVPNATPEGRAQNRRVEVVKQ